MKKSIIHLSVLLLVGCAFLALRPSPFTDSLAAEEAQSVRKIGVVNLDRVLAEYQGTKLSDKRLEQIYSEKQTQRGKMVSEIKSLREELLLLNEESRVKRQEEVEGRLKGLTEFDRGSRDALQKERDEALKKILDEVEEVVVSYAKENGYDLILSGRAVLFGVPAMDVTDPVLKALNGRYEKAKDSKP